MTIGSRQKTILIGLAITGAVALGLGVAGGLLAKWAQPPLALQLAALAVIVALAYPASLPWWRKLDEMARQAHLVSWFWGASIGGGIIVAWIVALAKRGEAPVAMAHGAALVFVGQAVVAMVFWAVWWMRRRGGKA